MKNRIIFQYLIILCALLGTQEVKGQKLYSTAIGFRAGWTSGLTVKQSIGGAINLEGIFGVRPYNTNFTLLVEGNKSTNTANLNWYYGAGAHISTYNRRYYYWDNRRYYNYYYYESAFGVDGIVGLEYKVPSAPIAFSLDVKPYIDFNRSGLWMAAVDPGLGIKVAF